MRVLKPDQITDKQKTSETTQNALRRYEAMRKSGEDPALVQWDGCDVEVCVVRRRDMGLVEEAKTAMDKLRERRAELMKELDEINGFLGQYGVAQPAPKKRGRPKKVASEA